MNSDEIKLKAGLGLSPEEWWHNHSSRGDWARGRYFQRVELERATPQMMDAFWADGWRHFGTTFFRDYFNVQDKRLVRVLPLRVNLEAFNPTRDQRRILKKNKDLDVSFRPTVITDEHMSLFSMHAERFTENKPPSLYSFLSLSPLLVPCPNLMCEIRQAGRLLAASFFDIGQEATSSIYAMFDPEHTQRGLGHFTLLSELAYARQSGKKYLYTGYAHIIPSYYDYKKRYRGTEFYDWRSRWRPMEEASPEFFPTHRFENSDIPEELLKDDEDLAEEEICIEKGESEAVDQAEVELSTLNRDHSRDHIEPPKGDADQ